MSTTPRNLLEAKLKLLCEGFQTTDEIASLFEGQNPSKVRRGGLSSGGKMLLFPLGDSTTVGLPVNAPLYHERKCDLVLVKGNSDRLQIWDKQQLLCNAQIISPPNWYNQTVDEFPITRIFTAHNRQLAASVYEDCCLFDLKKECRFCVIRRSVSNRDPRLIRKRPELFIEALGNIPVKQYGGITLNGGMTLHPGRGMELIVPVVEAIHQTYPVIPIAVEITPPEDLEWVDRLAKAGTTSLMMNMECWDDGIRKTMIPGKYEYCPKSFYFRAFERAIATLGAGRISSCFVVGTYPMESLKEGIRQVTAVGVVPSPLAGRHFEDIPGYPFVANVSWKDLGTVTSFAKRQMFLAGLVTADRAGCVACGMCDVIKDIRRSSATEVNPK